MTQSVMTVSRGIVAKLEADVNGAVHLTMTQIVRLK